MESPSGLQYLNSPLGFSDFSFMACGEKFGVCLLCRVDSLLNPEATHCRRKDTTYSFVFLSWFWYNINKCRKLFPAMIHICTQNS